MTTRRVRVSASSDNDGASRIPASAASAEPVAQLHTPTNAGRVPLSSANSRLSTTARMATPIRVPNNSARSPTATRPVSATTVTWCQVTYTDESWNPDWPKNPGKRRASGFQMFTAKPMRNSVRPIVTTSDVATDTPWSRRIRNRSISAPASGATTRTTTNNATGAGQSWWKRSSQ